MEELIFGNMEDFATEIKVLTPEEQEQLSQQDIRLVPEHKVEQLETDAKKHWDLFYKRNDTRFFKDRHWTTREFEELLQGSNSTRTLFEIGCGVGNFLYPILGEGLDFEIFACDLSPRAVALVKRHNLYDESRVHVFQADITTDDVYDEICPGRVDIATLIFVLSAVHPEKFELALRNVYAVLKPGGVLLFRDYGLYDRAQLRFKAGHKIAENFYMRQDGTRTYYFSTEFLEKLFTDVGFEVVANTYVHRRTVNLKENIDVPRIFVQARLRKPK